jgi:hypothetical protein
MNESYPLSASLSVAGSAMSCRRIEVPLTVRETAGVNRHQWPIRAGVPLPKGAVRSVEKLQILDTQGRFVPALFAVANRWWEDGSIQWVHCDFAATVPANSQTSYVLRDVVVLPEFPSPMGFIPRGKAFEVITDCSGSSSVETQPTHRPGLGRRRLGIQLQ